MYELFYKGYDVLLVFKILVVIVDCKVVLIFFFVGINIFNYVKLYCFEF